MLIEIKRNKIIPMLNVLSIKYLDEISHTRFRHWRGRNREIFKKLANEILDSTKIPDDIKEKIKHITDSDSIKIEEIKKSDLTEEEKESLITAIRKEAAKKTNEDVIEEIENSDLDDKTKTDVIEKIKQNIEYLEEEIEIDVYTMEISKFPDHIGDGSFIEYVNKLITDDK